MQHKGVLLFGWTYKFGPMIYGILPLIPILCMLLNLPVCIYDQTMSIWLIPQKKFQLEIPQEMNVWTLANSNQTYSCSKTPPLLLCKSSITTQKLSAPNYTLISAPQPGFQTGRGKSIMTFWLVADTRVTASIIVVFIYWS